jgi:dephospho-CoA kinase
VRVALTGGIATGKSVVGRVLRSNGIPTIDADQLARDAVLPGTPGLDAVVARFGRHVLRPDGTLDRPALGRLVFADAEARHELEALLHPIVRQGVERFYAQLDRAVGVAEIPLLFETGWVRNVDLTLVAACRRATQRARLVQRDGLTPEAAEQRLRAQWPVEDKARLADAVVVTEGAMAATVEQATRLAGWIRDRLRPS